MIRIPVNLPQKKLVLQIMEERDVSNAISYIHDFNSHKTPDKRFADFKNIRRLIQQNPAYHRKEAVEEILDISKEVEEPDKTRLVKLSTMGYGVISMAQNRSSTFKFKETFEALKRVKLFKDPYYEFVTPDNIVEQYKNYKSENIIRAHNHQKKPKNNYTFSEVEIDAMIDQAVKYINSEIDCSNKINSLKMMDCLSLLTGRRKWEIASTLQIKTSPNSDYQAYVRGLCKNPLSSLNGDPEWVPIPLLAHISVITSGILKARIYKHESGKYAYRNKIFPRMTHTEYRNIYQDRAYKDRHINKFLDGVSCSELAWKMQALCITLNTLTSHYSVLRIQDNESKPESDSSDGEREYKRQRI